MTPSLLFWSALFFASVFYGLLCVVEFVLEKTYTRS